MTFRKLHLENLRLEQKRTIGKKSTVLSNQADIPPLLPIHELIILTSEGAGGARGLSVGWPVKKHFKRKIAMKIHYIYKRNYIWKTLPEMHTYIVFLLIL